MESQAALGDQQLRRTVHILLSKLKELIQFRQGKLNKHVFCFALDMQLREMNWYVDQKPTNYT